MLFPNHDKTSLANAMSVTEAKKFVEKWLPAWTGNNPELLASFYSDDAHYSDPAIPEGVNGKAALLNYFKKLLAKNPNWVWISLKQTPMENGFVNHWQATIPVGNKTITCTGVCLVYIRDGKIFQNDVYFDRSELSQELALLHSTNTRNKPHARL